MALPEKIRCDTCFWWTNARWGTGECRGAPPGIAPNGYALWPKTHEAEGCALHAPDAVEERQA